jgi:DNA-binding transcriptional regulator YdaS (Cro superfamily)
MTLEELVEAMNKAANRLGSQKALAEKLGVSAAHINDVLKGRREPGRKILTALGLRKITSYERKDP